MQRAMTVLVMMTWAAVLLGGAFRPQGPGPGAAAQPRPGYRAPALTLVDLQGQPVSLEAYRGRAVFLNFWASWCPPCRLEMPEIERLAASLPEGTAVLTVNATTRESGGPATVAAFLRSTGYTFPVALDQAGQAEAAYGVVSFPTSLFISPDGVVTARVNGPLTGGAMAGYLKAARR
ncbi:MAG TPA: TlpA disulfide reductase family protein [Symbiobacteriaceae bacterium]